MAPDPRATFGSLNNGFRYAILQVADDTGTVSIQLNISSDFNNEPEETYGIAHLLEHMIFRRTNKDKEQSIIHDMQTLGAGYGFGFNGFTTNENTFYRVNLTCERFDKVSIALQNFGQLVMTPNFTTEYSELENKVV